MSFSNQRLYFPVERPVLSEDATLTIEQHMSGKKKQLRVNLAVFHVLRLFL